MLKEDSVSKEGGGEGGERAKRKWKRRMNRNEGRVTSNDRPTTTNDDWRIYRDLPLERKGQRFAKILKIQIMIK